MFTNNFDESLLQELLKNSNSKDFRIHLCDHKIFENDLSQETLELLSDEGGPIDAHLIKSFDNYKENEKLVLRLIENYW